MSSYTLEVGSARYNLKLTARWAEKCEELLGKPVVEALDDILRTRTLAVLLWGALQCNHPCSIDNAYDIIDGLVDEGRGSIEERGLLAQYILETAGFFTPEETALFVKSVVEQQKAAQKRVQEALKEASPEA